MAFRRALPKRRKKKESYDIRRERNKEVDDFRAKAKSALVKPYQKISQSRARAVRRLIQQYKADNSRKEYNAQRSATAAERKEAGRAEEKEFQEAEEKRRLSEMSDNEIATIGTALSNIVQGESSLDYDVRRDLLMFSSYARTSSLYGGERTKLIAAILKARRFIGQ